MMIVDFAHFNLIHDFNCSIMSLKRIFAVTSQSNIIVDPGPFEPDRDIHQGCILVDERAIRNRRSDNAS